MVSCVRSDAEQCNTIRALVIILYRRFLDDKEESFGTSSMLSVIGKKGPQLPLCHLEYQCLLKQQRGPLRYLGPV